MKLSPSSRAFLSHVHDVGVRCLLTGGHAVNVHGYTRPTHDLDLWLPRDLAVADEILGILRLHGMELPQLTAQQLVARDLVQIGSPPFSLLVDRGVIQIGHEPFEIELLLWVSELDFDDSYRRRSPAMLDGVPIDVVGLNDLLRCKRATAAEREVDATDAVHLADLAALASDR